MKNDEVVRRSLAAVWHPCTQMKAHERFPLVPIERAEGPWLHDFEGRRILDGVSSWWVNLFGHANPAINAALKAQLDTLEHVMLAGCTHEPAVELAERLSARTGGVLGHAFFASDGASAVEIALKMSFHSWRNRGESDKREFVCLANSYHGETIGALEGERLQRVPRGFPKDHVAAEFLRYRQFLAGRELPPADAIKPAFYRTLVDTFRVVVPLLRFLNEPLAAPPRRPDDELP